MKKLKAVLVGAGNRGQIYCDYSLKHKINMTKVI